jgi:hypothetical protein
LKRHRDPTLASNAAPESVALLREPVGRAQQSCPTGRFERLPAHT